MSTFIWILLIFWIAPNILSAIGKIIVWVIEYRLEHSKYRDGRKRPESWRKKSGWSVKLKPKKYDKSKNIKLQ